MVDSLSFSMSLFVCVLHQIDSAYSDSSLFLFLHTPRPLLTSPT